MPAAIIGSDTTAADYYLLNTLFHAKSGPNRFRETVVWEVAVLSLRPIAGWTLGAMALLLSIAIGQSLMSTLGMFEERVSLAWIGQFNEQWLARGYDWASIPYVCLVAGEGLLAAWLLGTGSRLIPRDTVPILAHSGIGMILTALTLYAAQGLGSALHWTW